MTAGNRFSQAYLARGAPARDSERFRRRIKEKLIELTGGSRQLLSDFGQMLAKECGADIFVSGSQYYPLQMYEKGELRDVLDSITVLHQFLTARRASQANALRLIGASPSGSQLLPDPKQWIAFVERAFREENMGYRIDEKGGVHYYVDQEFEHARAATLMCLEHPSLLNARSSFEDAFRHLDNTPMDTKAAVRSVFEALEIIAKQLFPEAQNLNRKLVEGKIKAALVASRPNDATESKVWGGMLDGMADWVDALHNYRHGQAADDIVAPSEGLAVFAVSSGCTYIRALAERVG